MHGRADAWWRDDVQKDAQLEPPYPMPTDWEYQTVAAPAGIRQGKINVHLVPHTVRSATACAMAASRIDRQLWRPMQRRATWEFSATERRCCSLRSTTIPVGKSLSTSTFSTRCTVSSAAATVPQRCVIQLICAIVT